MNLGTLRPLFAAALVGSAAMLGAQSAGPMPLAWKWQQATGVAPGIPVVTPDTVFHAVGRRVYALDPETGNQKWRFPVADPLDANFRFGVQLGKSILVAAAEDRNVYGLDPNTGERKWQYEVGQALACPPVIAGNTVVLGLANRTIIAINADNGEAAWADALKLQDSIRGNMAATPERFIVCDESRNVQCFDVATARPLWSQRIGELAANVAPVIFDDTAYLHAGTYVLGLSINSRGAARYSVNVRETVVQPVGVSVDMVAVATESGKIRAFNRSSGTPLNRSGIDLQARAINPPVVTGNLVAVNTTNGSLNLVNPLLGETAWNYILRPAFPPQAGNDGQQPPKYMTATAPAVFAGDTIYLAGRDGSLQAFNSKTGVDLTAPTTEMLWPVAGSELNPTNTENGKIDLFWQLDDQASGLKLDSVTVTANGKAMVHTLTRDGILYVRLSDAKNSVPNGRTVFKVKAADWLGNTVETEYVLTFDTTLPRTKQPGGPAPTSTSGSGGGGTGATGN